MIPHPTGKPVHDVIESIKKSYHARAYTPMIRSVKFLNYKNVANGKNLDFDFPVTLIVGPNGTNKTSILRAIESCPRGKSLSDYWFDTDLDPIPQLRSRLTAGSENPEYTYSYDLPENSRIKAKVMKYMTFKNGRDDYFEPAKRVDNDEYGSLSVAERDSVREYRKKEGWKPVSKKVIYIDMRQRVPAYDINMSYGFSEVFFENQNKRLKKEIEEEYLGDRKAINDEYNKRKMTMKRYVRRASARISDVFNGVNVEENKNYYGKERFSENIKELTDSEIRWIRYILGRNYTKIAILKHSYFKLEGVTVRVEVEDLKNERSEESSGRESIKRRYSEAYAGSGEYAVIMMVHNIYVAAEKTLILMDEPENSLHPESQRRLMEYILNETLKKKHQIIISTHSPYMSENLPNDARIALFLESGFVNPQMGITHREAFRGIGAESKKSMDQIIIKVEDELASHIVKRSLLLFGEMKSLKKYDIDIFGSSTNAIQRYIPAGIKSNSEDVLWILDGDCNRQNQNGIISRLENKFGPVFGYEYYACRVALYYVANKPETEKKKKNYSNGYEAVEAYLSALEGNRPDVDQCLKKVNEKVDNFILPKGNSDDSDEERRRSIKSVFEWLEKHVKYLPGDENPEAWILRLLGMGDYSGKQSKNKIANFEAEIREDCVLMPGDPITSEEILHYGISLVNKVDKNEFKPIYEVINRFDS